jgi:hypothetical protein
VVLPMWGCPPTPGHFGEWVESPRMVAGGRAVQASFTSVRGLARLKRHIGREPLDRRLRLCQIPLALKGVVAPGG